MKKFLFTYLTLFSLLFTLTLHTDIYTNANTIENPHNVEYQSNIPFGDYDKK